MRYRGNGGVIGPTVSSNSTFASGFWSMPEFQQRLGAGTWPTDQTSTYLEDANFEYVTMLLKSIGANTAQNYTFLDSSTNNFTVTRNGDGDVTQGAFSPFGIDDGKWSAYFDGNGDYLSGASWSSAGNFGVGDFTVECWVYATAAPQNNQVIWGCNSYPNTTGLYLAYYGGASNNLGVRTGATALIDSSAGWQFNTWLHVAVVRSGGTLTLYINGTNRGSTTFTNNCTDGLQYIGRPSDTSNFAMQGYISNLRITKSAVYTTAFTPPTSHLTAISGTSLLTCQSNRFKDNSTNNFTLTRNGDTKVSAFTPFNQTAAYSASTNGGSAYFDGTGDTLTIASSTPNQFGSGDFTIETWYYCSGAISTSGQHLFFRRTTAAALGLIFQVDNSKLNLLAGDTNIGGWEVNISSTTTLTANRWYHLAMSRSGSSWKIFVDGVQEASINASFTIAEETGNITIGTNITGYLSNLRVVKGTAVYTSNFTPPTSPVTAIANTSLLLNATNAGIVDASRKSNLYTVGNAQVRTDVVKFDKSMYFDGTGDYITALNPTPLGSGNFTVECWFYCTTALFYGTLFSTDDGTNSANGIRLVTGSSNNKLAIGVGSSGILESSSTFSLNVWNHVAMVRNNGVITLYLNGVSVGTVSNSTNFSLNNYIVGRYGNDFYWIGYIEDLRVTVGLARYTTNFTPPISAFSTL